MSTEPFGYPCSLCYSVFPGQRPWLLIACEDYRTPALVLTNVHRTLLRSALTGWSAL